MGGVCGLACLLPISSMRPVNMAAAGEDVRSVFGVLDELDWPLVAAPMVECCVSYKLYAI